MDSCTEGCTNHASDRIELRRPSSAVESLCEVIALLFTETKLHSLPRDLYWAPSLPGNTQDFFSSTSFSEVKHDEKKTNNILDSFSSKNFSTPNWKSSIVSVHITQIQRKKNRTGFRVMSVHSLSAVFILNLHLNSKLKLRLEIMWGHQKISFTSVSQNQLTLLFLHHREWAIFIFTEWRLINAFNIYIC